MTDATDVAIEELVLVSVDDHVVEPPGMFDAHVPERWRDRAPRVVHKDGPNGGFDVWSFDGRDVPNIALNAVAGRPPHRYGIDPTSFDELRPGEAFQLVNDHDPRPLLYQFSAQRGGSFDWTYQEQGPDVWRVRISRTA